MYFEGNVAGIAEEPLAKSTERPDQTLWDELYGIALLSDLLRELVRDGGNLKVLSTRFGKMLPRRKTPIERLDLKMYEK